VINNFVFTLILDVFMLTFSAQWTDLLEATKPRLHQNYC